MNPGEPKPPWTTCVTLSWQPREKGRDGGWIALIRWTWGKFSHPEMIQGAFANRYPTGMRRAVDQVMDMASSFGLVTPPGLKMALCVSDDTPLPKGWQEKILKEAKRRGWDSYPEKEEV